MKRFARALALVAALLLALPACGPAGGFAAAPTPSGLATSTSKTAGGPGASPTSTPTGPPPSLAPAATCADPAVRLNRAPARATGAFGSHRSTGSSAVALTFDDGPDPVNTPLILEALRHCGVKATFCVEGYKSSLHPEIIRQIAAEGHTLCNHTWLHIRQLGTYGPLLIREDLQKTLDAIHQAVPDAKVSYFRAPGGNWSADYVSVAHELGMTPIDWDVDPSDWDFDTWGTGAAMTSHIIANVEANVRPGSIVLSHDYQKPATTAAYRVLLPWLTARFTLIPLPPDGPRKPPPPVA